MVGKKAIVFGGAGFVGCHFLGRLAQGGRYTTLYSVDIAEPRFADPKIQYVKFDIRNPIPSTLCGEGPFDIFNFAAVHTTPGHEDWEYYWTNVHGAINVCRFASDVGADRMLFTSTMMVYGPTEAPKDEDAVLEPVNAYGRSKILAEDIHRSWQLERPDMRRLTIVRPGVIYGLAERGNFTRLSQALRQRRFVYPGRTDTIKACGYVEDLVSSMIEMEERNEGFFLYNFCHPERYTSKDICAAFSSVAGYPEPRFVVPVWLLGVAAFGFEVLSALGLKNDINRARVGKLYQSTNMVPTRLQEVGFKYCYDLPAGLSAWKASSRRTDFD
jgi:nucleoside-diphosphate-sugar epimerase